MSISGKKQIIIGFVTVILLMIGIFLFRNIKDNKKIDSDISENQNNNSLNSTEEALEIYVNEKYGYNFMYPIDWIINDSDLAHVTVSKGDKEKLVASVSIATVDFGDGSVFDDGSKVKIAGVRFLGRNWKSFVCPESDTCLEMFAHRKHLRVIDYPAGWEAKNQISLDVYKGPGQEKLIQEAEKIIASFELRSEK